MSKDLYLGSDITSCQPRLASSLQRNLLTNKHTVVSILTKAAATDMGDVEDSSHSSSASSADENEEVEEAKKAERRKKMMMNMPKGFRGWLRGLQGRLEKSEVSRVDSGLEEMKTLVRKNRGLLFARDLTGVDQNDKEGWKIMWAGKVLQIADEKASLIFLPKGNKEEEEVKVYVCGNWEEGNEKTGNIVAFKRRAGKQKAGNVEVVEMVRKRAKEIAVDVFQLVAAKI